MPGARGTLVSAVIGLDLAQRIVPELKAAYFDNDVMVMAHAQSWLTGGSGGTVGNVEADLREPEQTVGCRRRYRRVAT